MLGEEPKFNTGDRVVCISENFAKIATTDVAKSTVGTQAQRHPIIGEVLTVYDNLGDFICFDKYNDKDPEYLEGVSEFHWFHQSRFESIQNKQTVKESLMVQLFN
ncbi:hypothetical protein [Brevundimonas sp.]|jgi:hypothetical protein|uniref:hypothetical protein n=1 Tax=Brevundimonas sp. TaxID=1871086 RepID=UPI00378417F0